MGAHEGNLHVELDDPGMIVDPERGEQEHGDADEDDQHARGGLGHDGRGRLDVGWQGGVGPLGDRGGRRHDALRLVLVHDAIHLALAFNLWIGLVALVNA